MAISVVIPVRDDDQALAGLLDELRPLRGAEFEVIVVEALPPGGAPGTSSGAPGGALADQWLLGVPGRARQLQQGAQAARHSCLWFLHADTRDVAAAAAWLAAHCARGGEAPLGAGLMCSWTINAPYCERSPGL